MPFGRAASVTTIDGAAGAAITLITSGCEEVLLPTVETAATVAYLEAKRGMGLAFREMPDCYTNTLQKWLAKGTSKPAN